MQNTAPYEPVFTAERRSKLEALFSRYPTRRATLLPGVITRDINGNEASNGEYLNPVGIGYPEFVEIDLNAIQTPFSFDAIPWSSDRRVGPGGAGAGGGVAGAAAVAPTRPATTTQSGEEH